MRLRLALVVLALSSVQCARIADLGHVKVSDDDADAGGTGINQSDPNVTIDPPSFDYGTGACGVEIASPKLLSIHNSGDAPIDYMVQVPPSSGIRVDGMLTGSIPPNGTVSLQTFVTPLLADANSADIVVTAGSAFQTVHIASKGTGPTMDLAPDTVAFGEIRKEDDSLPATVQVTNRGNADLNVASFMSSDPAFIVASPLAPVPPGGTNTFNVQLLHAAADDKTELSATITPVLSVVCGTPPVLKVSGKRVTTNITVTAADWGNQACATTPANKQLVIQNYTTEMLSYTLQQAPASAFMIKDNGPNPMPVGSEQAPSTATLTVTPNMLPSTAPLNDIMETLGLTFNGGTVVKDLMKTTTLHVHPHGIILTINPATMTFNNSGSKGFSVTNSGNDPAVLGWQWVYAGNNPFGVSGQPNLVLGGTTANGASISYKNGPGNVTLQAQQAGIYPECSPFGKLALTGTAP